MIIFNRTPCENLTSKLKDILGRVSPKTFSEKFTKFKEKAVAWLRSTPENKQPSAFYDDNDPPINVLEDRQTIEDRELWAKINESGMITDDTQPGACRKLLEGEKYYLPQLKHYYKQADISKGGYLSQTFYACGWMEDNLFQALTNDEEFNKNFEYVHQWYKDGKKDTDKPIDPNQEFYTFQEFSA